MVCLKPDKLTMGSLLIAVALQGVGLPTMASTNLAKSTPKEVIAQKTTPSQSPPIYLPTAPPPPVDPLPSQRQQQEEQTVGSDYRISTLQPDNQGNLWVGSWQGLAKIDPKTGRILARISLPNVTVGALALDRMGRIWVGTYEGLIRVDPRTGEITAQNFTLPSNRVLSLLRDARGYLWVGTDNGLVLISPDQGLIMTTLKNLPGVSANTLSIDGKGNLWVGTLDGVVQVNTASALLMKRVTGIPGSAVQAITSRTEAIPQTPPPQVQQTVTQPARPTATRTGVRGKPASNRKPAKPLKPKPLPPILKTQLWVGTPNALVEIDADTGQILQTVDRLSGRSITALRFDRTDRLWAGTSNGLFRVNPVNGAVDGEIIAKLPSSRVVSLSPDAGGKLWVGTSQGLAWVSMQTFRTEVHNTFSRR